MYKIDVDRLSKNELQYELSIRGISETGTVEVLRRCLRSLLSLEKSGATVHSSVVLDSQTEITTCNDKIKELADNIATFSGSESQTRKIETKISHLIARIDRIPDQDKTVNEERSKTLLSLTQCISNFEDKLRVFKSQVSQATVPTDPNFSNSITQNLPLTPTGHSSPSTSCNNFNTINVSPTPIGHSCAISSPVWRWGFKFSGNNSEISFNAFLERVNELCYSRGVDKDTLFKCAADLFEGDALNYYHLVARYCTDWDGLVKLLKDEFIPSYVSDKLWKQIMERTQGSSEPIGIYVAAMTKLFDRMPIPVADELRLKVLRANILPFYQERLSLHDVHSPFEIIELCRKLEETRLRVEEFKPPKKGNLSLEPDLDYRPPKRESNRNHDRTFVREVRGEEPVNNRPTPRVCFNCKKPNHFARDCPSIKCFGCGKQGVTKKTCPKCNRTSQNKSKNVPRRHT